MENQRTILIADDDQDTLEFFEYNLKSSGYQVVLVRNGKEALELCQQQVFDLIVLDVVMPEIDGIEVCLQLRSSGLNQHSIIIFLTGRVEDYAQISGYEAGGDDYLIKPVKPRIFLSKVKSLLRRIHHGKEYLHVIGDMYIDTNKRSVILDQKEITLARKEYDLLHLLASRPGTVFTRNEILKSVWGESIAVGERTVDVHIQKIRNKVGERYIKTIIGIGYKIDY